MYPAYRGNFVKYFSGSFSVDRLKGYQVNNFLCPQSYLDTIFSTISVDKSV